MTQKVNLKDFDVKNIKGVLKNITRSLKMKYFYLMIKIYIQNLLKKSLNS